MFCQVELVKYYIRTGDLAAGDGQYNKLINEFADNNNLPSNVCFIGDTYLRAGETDLANLLYTNVLSTWPENPQTIFAKAGFAKVAIQLGQDSQVNNIIDEILADYTKDNDIASAIYGIGEHYWNLAFGIKKVKMLQKPVVYEDELEPPNQKMTDYYSHADSVWEKLIESLPDSALSGDATFMTGEVYRALEQYPKAIEYYTNFVDKWPQHENAWIGQERVISIYRELKFTGKNPKPEGDRLLVAAQEKLLQQFPDCPIVENVTKDMSVNKKRIAFYESLKNNKVRNIRGKQEQEGGSK